SVAFCTEEMIERFKEIEYIKDYLEGKKVEIENFNKVHQINSSNIVNGRRLTNIGTFRAYVEEYLHHHPQINQDMIQMVRQLQPTENGLPIEIYAFTDGTAWVNYEGTQADLFDHILAVIPQFDLRIYQAPSGYDFKGEGYGL
ncbi:MAG TPA: mechanosensitive ion channel, partial [Epulopiscium sp.]|nr:mechanosensitive ion channel [Candidatus Epulonipiscium sp.]